MPGISDIARRRHSAEINGTKIDIRGLSLGSIGVVVAHFGELEKALAGVGNLDIAKILVEAPQAVAAVVVKATGGDPENAEEREAFLDLELDDQLTLLEKVKEATMPRGWGPFVERLECLLGVKNLAQRVAEFMKAPATSSSAEPTS